MSENKKLTFRYERSKKKSLVLHLLIITCYLLIVSCPNPWVEPLLEVFDREKPFTVTVVNGKGGGEYKHPETVTIEADNPLIGQEFSHWSVNSGGVTLANPNDKLTTFTMPRNDVRVTANFAVEDGYYLVTVNSGTLSGGATSGYFEEGDTVSITANTAAAGKQFLEWSATGVTLTSPTSASTSFTMPANPVTVTATYKDAPVYSISLSSGGTSLTTYTFPTALDGYTTLPSLSVTVTNTGNQPTGDLSVTFSNTTSFRSSVDDATYGVIPLTLSSIAVDGTATFYFRALLEMAVGPYTTTVTVSNTVNGISESFNVSFTVVAPPEMVNIPAVTGWIVNGSSPPGGTASLSAFQMGKYEVTQELYLAVMGYSPSSFSSNPAAGEVQSKRPVEMVTWYDAIEFCNKLSELEGLQSVYTITGRTPATGYPITSATVTATWTNNGYRLPTEAQWQYAAEAGSATEVTIADDTGWYIVNSNNMTHEVGKKLPNDWGLYDMLGNVYEWCWDRYSDTYPSSANDPTGAASGTSRVLRGGSWTLDATNARSALRYSYNPGLRLNNLGFRVVRPL